MAEIFGAVGTAIALLDLVLKRTKTISRFRKDAEGVVAEVTRLSQELERRTELLRDLNAELKGLDFRGSAMALRCLEACENEIRELKTIVTLFELRLADGRSWWTLLTTKLEFAWKKEDVTELHKNMCSANGLLADALRASQLYLQRAALRELRGIRTQDIPSMQSALHQIRVEELPQLTRALSTSIDSGSDSVVRELRAEAQSTRGTVLERGWVTTAEIKKLETAIGRMLVSNRVDIQAALLPPMEQHMDGLHQSYVKELRDMCDQVHPSSTVSQFQGASAPGTSASTSPPPSSPRGHLKTKPMAAVRWEKRLPLGLGSVSLRREVRQRVLIRIRRYMSETDTSIDTETTWILGFIPNSWFFGTAITGVNWKFSFRATRRLKRYHPAWDAARDNDIDAMIEYFREGSLSINDIDEEDGNSLLHIAAQSYSYALCEWLVDNGADSHAANDMLETAIFSLVTDTSGDAFYKRYPQLRRPSYTSYDPLMNLLVERCQLDPNDLNMDGVTVLESDQFSDNVERFSRLFTLSMALCTEPEGHRIKTLFESIAFETRRPSTVLRLQHLIEEYQRTGLPQGVDGRKWWQTTDYLWRLAERLGGTSYYRNGFRAESGHEIDIPGGWVDDQLCILMRAGVDLHTKEDQQTLLDYLISESSEFLIHKEAERTVQPGRLIRWLQLLHKSEIDLAGYMQQEDELHRGGELFEDYSHIYHEYPVFTAKYEGSKSIFRFTRGVVVLDHADPIYMPGTWQPDPELYIWEQRARKVRRREIEGKLGPIGRAGSSLRQSVAAPCSGPPDPDEDDRIYDWELADGRKGRMYPLWEISTAGFDHADYSTESALTFIRDLTRYPLYMEYTDGWLYYPKVIEPVDEYEGPAQCYRSVGGQYKQRNPDPSVFIAWLNEFAGSNGLLD